MDIITIDHVVGALVALAALVAGWGLPRLARKTSNTVDDQVAEKLAQLIQDPAVREKVAQLVMKLVKH